MLTVGKASWSQHQATVKNNLSQVKTCHKSKLLSAKQTNLSKCDINHHGHIGSALSTLWVEDNIMANQGNVGRMVSI